jgi:hypothetical protein
MTDEPKKKRKRKVRPSGIELRLREGAKILKTLSEKGCAYTFADTGKAARADVVERLISAGKLAPQGDGLFGDDAQTWALAEAA